MHKTDKHCKWFVESRLSKYGPPKGKVTVLRYHFPSSTYLEFIKPYWVTPKERMSFAWSRGLTGMNKDCLGQYFQEDNCAELYTLAHNYKENKLHFLSQILKRYGQRDRNFN
jgi:hypothetical protein